MKSTLRKACSALMALALAAAPLAASNVGTATGVFLRIMPGARPAGMGGAFVGICDDANALAWNPAGLSRAKSTELTATHMLWMSDITNTYAGVVKPLGKKNAIGVAVDYMSMGQIDERDATTGAATGKTYAVYDAAAALSYSRKLMAGFNIGFTARQLIQQLGPVSGSGMAFDIGSIYTVSRKVSVGLSVLNLGGSIKMDKSETIPMTIMLGAGYKPVKNLTVGAEVDQPSDGGTELHAGAEYRVADIVLLRAGYSNGGVTLGMGIQSTVNGSGEFGEEIRLYNIEINYAAVTLKDSGDFGHRISINLKF